MPPLRSTLLAHRARLASFSLVGVVNTITDFVIFSLLVGLGVAPLLANVGSFLAANPQSYILNAKTTFRQNGQPAPLSLRRYGVFMVSHLGTLGLHSVAIWLLAPYIGALPAKLASLVVTVGLNYASSAAWVFKPALSGEHDKSTPKRETHG